VYSPFQRNWLSKLNANLHWLDEAPGPAPNNASIHKNPTFQALFNCIIPDHVDGFECADHEAMEVLWPEGTFRAKEVLLPLTELTLVLISSLSDPAPLHHDEVPRRPTRPCRPIDSRR
jgi:hypothetical protein